MTRKASSGAAILPIDRASLRRWPLPEPDEAGDKNDRGRVLVIGGGRSVPGAIVLSAIAALRAGAGKLQLATVREAAIALGISIPEARVIALDAGRAGEIEAAVPAALRTALESADAVLVGPGMLDGRAAAALVRRILPLLRGATLILDAGALTELPRIRRDARKSDARLILTPHPGEMATLAGVPLAGIEADPAAFAARAAHDFGAVVALKGPNTHVASARGEIWRYDGGGIGLATSGSGDTLAGLVAGFAARGAEPAQAAAWAVYLHGAAGRTLARTAGRTGYLARELLDVIPAELIKVQGGVRR